MSELRLFGFLAAAAATLTSCGGDVYVGGGGDGGDAGAAGPGVGGSGTGGSSGSGGSGGSTPSATDKLDVLFVIDNSASMADKQDLLATVVPDLMAGLADAGEFTDVHVGILSSSLGGHGADSCSPAHGGQFNPTMDDGAHLIARDLNGASIPTHANLGFLAWDPAQRATPPGDPDLQNVSLTLQAAITGVGETGCGFEAPLEAWYRFLIDPEPYARLVRVPCFTGDGSNGCVAEDGVDDVLLRQRADFLRPDSVLTIIMVGDEDDCSVIDDGQFFISVQSDLGAKAFHLPRPTDECAESPDHPCCRSCGQPTPNGCPDNSTYASCAKTDGFYDDAGMEDQLNLRCHEQKQRFGIDFLYPLGRYVSGLRDASIRVKWNEQDARKRVPNPLYSASTGVGAAVRDPSMVYLGGLLGVPWQLIADSPTPSDPPGTLRYKTADAIAAEGLWDEMVGTCPHEEVSGDCCFADGKLEDQERCAIDARNVRGQPLEPLMVPSSKERSGVGVAGTLAPSDSPPRANAANGHEWHVADNDDLQYACTFPLPAVRDCSYMGSSCDCTGSQEQLDLAKKPLCQDPVTGAYTNIQVAGKAYPTPRQLTVMKAFGSNSLLGSICPRNVTNRSAPDYGYRPFINLLLGR